MHRVMRRTSPPHVLSWFGKPLAPTQEYVHLVGYGQHQIHRKITEHPQKCNGESTRQEPAPTSRSCQRGQVAIPRARFKAAREREDQPEDAGPWLQAGDAQSHATATRVRPALPALPAVERFRVPFVRGFGYDEHPIVHRRIKS